MPSRRLRADPAGRPTLARVIAGYSHFCRANPGCGNTHSYREANAQPHDRPATSASRHPCPGTCSRTLRTPSTCRRRA